MKLIVILGSVILLALLIFSVWNWITLRKISSKNKEAPKSLADPRYYELKYKIQFLIAVFTLIAGLAGFLGYGSIENVGSIIRKELKNKIDSLQTNIVNTENEVSNKDSLVNNLKNILEELTNSFPSIEDKIRNQKKDLELLETKIEIINNKNIIKQNYYVISPLSLKRSFEQLTVYYKDLETNNRDKLPQFNSPPLVIPVSHTGDIIDVYDITSNYFRVGYGSSYETNTSDSIKFSILIFEK